MEAKKSLRTKTVRKYVKYVNMNGDTTQGRKHLRKEKFDFDEIVWDLRFAS